MPFLLLVGAFLIGAVPTGYLVVLISKGENIQKIGSGNIGSTNVGRVAGKKAALLTQAVDVSKGALVTLLTLAYVNWRPTPWLAEGVALATMLGNAYTPFLRFRGGKGVTTMFGVFAPLSPLAAVLSFFCHLVIGKIAGFISLASLVAGFVAILAAGFIYGWTTRTAVLIISYLLVIWLHRSNIYRLYKGSEHRESKATKQR